MKVPKFAKSFLRALLGLGLLIIAGYFLLPIVLIFLANPVGGTHGKHAKQHSHFASQFKAGDSNAPWLAMDWFSEHGVYFCRVSQSGSVHSARDVGHAIQGGSGISSRFSLDSTNRPLLEGAINALPPSSSRPLSKDRQILISGIRSNQWFKRVYDRADVPPEVERLYGLTDAYLEWFIPVVSGRFVGRTESEASGCAAASDAPVAVIIAGC